MAPAAVLSILLLSCLCGQILSEPLRFQRQRFNEPKQEWGYVDVRADAHMFYWLYYTTHTAGFNNRPLIMWLQGGPGGSSTGYGNFEEMGPLDVDLKERNSTWLQTASLMYVDNPVGAGYSYVDNDSAYTKDVTEIANDMMVLLQTVFNEKIPQLQKVPFYIFCESYGGKMAAVISERLNQAVKDNEIKCDFRGVAMGDSWISPIDSTLTWAPYLYTNSLIDQSGLKAINKSAEVVNKAISDGDWLNATNKWGVCQDLIEKLTNGVDPYNILKWGPDPGSALLAGSDDLTRRVLGRLYQNKLSTLMNGPIREKLGIIPSKVTWGGQSDKVFNAMLVDFMKPVVDTVNGLIKNTNLAVVVYSGQLDLIVDTVGTEEWVYTLDIADDFRKADRAPILHPVTTYTSGYLKMAQNFSFYWILDAGHMIPADNPEMALKMVKMIIGP